MPFIKPLDTQMLMHACEVQGWKPQLHDDGVISVGFAFDEESRRTLTLNVAALGQEHEVLRVVLWATEGIEEQDWGRVIVGCNKWNTIRLWPTSFLRCDTEEPADNGRLCCEQYLDCEKGIHQEFVDHHVWQVYATALSFFRWGCQEEKLWT